MKHSKITYWSQLIIQIRQEKVWTQEELAERLQTDQATISRWECGESEPRSQSMRQKIESMAREAKLGSLGETISLVESSPFPLILVNQGDIVVAASASSGFLAGKTCSEQTPEEEQACLRVFQQKLLDSGFWEMQRRRMDYAFAGDDETRSAIVSRLTFWGEVYALVQKAW